MTKIGQVIKTYNGFYYVLAEENIGDAYFYMDDKLLPCRMRGKAKRNKNDVAITGDMVEYDVLDESGGVINRLLPRRNILFRPLVANVDQIVVTFAAKEPDLHPLLLNKMLVLAEMSGVPEITICVNKCDLLEEELRGSFLYEYGKAGYNIVRVSAEQGWGIGDLASVLRDKVSVFAGPSGVGKSSLLNAVEPNLQLATGSISSKIKRGKHTTRSARLIPLATGGVVVDTPGFSAADIDSVVNKENLSHCFPDFSYYAAKCRFSPCTHTHEPDCAVRQAVDDGVVSGERYKAYVDLYGILKESDDRKRRF